MTPISNRTEAQRVEMASIYRAVHYTRAMEQFRPASRAHMQPVAGGFAFYCGKRSPLNRAMGIGLYAPVSAAELDTIEQFYRQRGEPPMIDHCPLSDPRLQSELYRRGYRPKELLGAFIRRLDTLPPLRIPQGIEITPALPEEADLWIRTTAMGFEETDTPSAEIIELLTPNFTSANAHCYFARLDGHIAGGGAMYRHEDVVEFGGMSTLPGYRRRGIQNALLQFRLAEAQRMGCTLAVVYSEPGSRSQRNILRAGFQQEYIKVTMQQREG